MVLGCLRIISPSVRDQAEMKTKSVRNEDSMRKSRAAVLAAGSVSKATSECQECATMPTRTFYPKEDSGAT